jgi:hypothetical protein
MIAAAAAAKRLSRTASLFAIHEKDMKDIES